MVREFKMSDDLVVAAEIVSERHVVGDSREQHELLGICVSRVSLREDRSSCVVACLCEEDVLIASDSERFGPFALLPCVEVGRTLGYDNDIGSLDALRKVAKPSERHEMILEEWSVTVDEND